VDGRISTLFSLSKILTKERYDGALGLHPLVPDFANKSDLQKIGENLLSAKSLQLHLAKYSYSLDLSIILSTIVTCQYFIVLTSFGGCIFQCAGNSDEE
jgi:hypothetical protein